MPVGRVERIKAGGLIGHAARNAAGNYECHPFGSNVAPVECATLDEVVAYLRANPRAGVRMNPGWVKISRNIHVDGILL